MVIIFNFSENIEEYQYNGETFKCYLININSIPNFMKIIKESNILNSISNDKDKNINLLNLKSLLKNYEIEKDIKLYNIYEEIEIFDEFIFATDAFLDYIGFKNYIKDLKVVEVNNNNFSIKLFEEPLKSKSNKDLEPIYFEEHEIGIYAKRLKKNQSFNNKINNSIILKKLKPNLDSKTVLKTGGEIFILNEGKIGLYWNHILKIYETQKFEKLYEIKGKNCVINLIELDNNDLIILDFEEIVIYRLNEKKYTFFQKINSNKDNEYYTFKNRDIIQKAETLMYDFHNKYSYSYNPFYYNGFKYKIEKIKKLKGNRFISISNCGFKIYSLKNNVEYSYDLLNEFYYNIIDIYENNKDEIIIISAHYLENKLIRYYSQKQSGYSQNIPSSFLYQQPIQSNFGFSPFNQSIFGQQPGYTSDEYDIDHNRDLFIDKFNINKNKLEKIIYREKECNYLYRITEYIILKNKYFIIMLGENLLVIDLHKNILIKTFYCSGDLIPNFAYNINDWSHSIIKLKNIKDDNMFMLSFHEHFFIVELTIKDNEFNRTFNANLDKTKECPSNDNELSQISKNLANALIIIPSEDINLNVIGNFSIEKWTINSKFGQIIDVNSQYNFYHCCRDRYHHDEIIFY